MNETKYKCPRCKCKLFVIDMGKKVLLRCHKCGQLAADLTPQPVINQETKNVILQEISKPADQPSPEQNENTTN